jgi:DNA-binding NarL/FixJ family response regulator
MVGLEKINLILHNQVSNPIRLFIVDDHPITYMGIKSLLTNNSRFEITKYMQTTLGLEEAIIENKPDILIIDITMPGVSGLEFLEKNKENLPLKKVVIFTMHDGKGFYHKAKRLNIDGYILKSDEFKDFPSILEQIISGNTYISPSIKEYEKPTNKELSEKEISILDMLSNGMKYIEIAERIGLSPRTVEYHIIKLKDKFNAENNIELVKYYNINYFR